MNTNVNKKNNAIMIGVAVCAIVTATVFGTLYFVDRNESVTPMEADSPMAQLVGDGGATAPTELPKPALTPTTQGVGEMGATPEPDTDPVLVRPTKQYRLSEPSEMDAVTVDEDGMPNVSASYFGQMEDSYHRVVLEIAQQIEEPAMRVQFCNAHEMDTDRTLLKRCDTGAGPIPEAPAKKTASPEAEMKEMLIAGSCGTSWGMQKDCLDQLLTEDMNWTVDDLLELSDMAVAKVYDDQSADAASFRKQFCGKYYATLGEQFITMCEVGQSTD